MFGKSFFFGSLPDRDVHWAWRCGVMLLRAPGRRSAIRARASRPYSPLLRSGGAPLSKHSILGDTHMSVDEGEAIAIAVHIDVLHADIAMGQD